LKFWKDSSILRKFLVYGCAYRAKTNVKDFGIPMFQVVTVTTNRERIGKTQAMFQKRLAPRPDGFAPGQFLFTDFATLRAHDGDILSVPFENGAGKVRELV
jgi:hypothetical protein